MQLDLGVGCIMTEDFDDRPGGPMNEVGDPRRAAVARALASAAFRNAPSLAALLTFVAEETFAGRGADLDARAIHRGLMGPDAPFDGNASAAIRVRMARLRDRLADFYLDEGAGEDLRVRFRLGRYAPVFVEAERGRPARRPTVPSRPFARFPRLNATLKGK